MKKHLLVLIVLMTLLFSCKSVQPEVLKADMIDQSKYELVGYVFEFNDGGGGFADNIDKVTDISHHGGGFKKIEQVGVLRSSSYPKNISAAINYLNK